MLGCRRMLGRRAEIDFGTGWAGALTTISPMPFGREPHDLLASLHSPRVLAVRVGCVWGRALLSLVFVSWQEGRRLVVLVGGDLVIVSLCHVAGLGHAGVVVRCGAAVRPW